MTLKQAPFIVLEGLDGTGKSTQVKLLEEYFNKKLLKTFFIHFPRTNEESEIFGEMVAKYLRGDYGKLENVHPELVALIYAADRYNSSQLIENKLKNNIATIADRYVFSNIGFQCAKFPTKEQRLEFANKIFHLEYNYFKIPKPDISIFLHVPITFVEEKLKNERLGEERNYLNGKSDIHEQDIEFQKKVENVYLEMCKLMPEKLFYLNCINAEGKIMEPQEIHRNILDVLQTKRLINF